MKHRILILVAVVAVALVAASAAFSLDGGVGLCCGLNPHWNWTDNSGAVSNEVAQTAMHDVPFPLSEIKRQGGFLERRNLRERILRFNDVNKIGYVYILSLSGKPVGYYTIKGKISSTDSQLTTTDQLENHNSVQAAIASPGDDGTWGMEEGGTQGVFFFTTNGVMVETVMPWLYSDAPLPLSVPSLNPKQQPSSVSRFWTRTAAKGVKRS